MKKLEDFEFAKINIDTIYGGSNLTEQNTDDDGGEDDEY